MAISGTVSDTEKIIQLHQRIKQLEATEKKYRQQAQFFNEQLEHLPDVYYRFDIKENKYDYISPKILGLTGFTVDEFKQKTLEDAHTEIHPEDLEQVLISINELHASQSKQHSAKLIYRRRIKNGSYIWIQDNLTLLKDDNLQPLCYLGNASDITLQIEEEQRLQKAKKLNQFILDSNPNLIYVKNDQGRYLMANKALAAFFEMEQSQLIQRLNSDYFEENEQINFYNKAEMEMLRTSEPITYEEKFTTPSGKVYYLQTTKTPLKVPGESTLVLVNSTDITDKKKAENSLKLSEALYKNLINSLNFPFLMLDPYGKLKILNKSAMQWFNFQENEWEGLYWKKIDSLRKIAKASGKDFSKFTKQVDFEVCIQKNGHSIWHWCNIQPVVDHQHEKIGFQVIIFDITSRKNTIEKLKQNEITFRGILNASSDLVFLINQKSKLITANEAAQEHCGLPLEQMKNKDLYQLLGKEKGHLRQHLADHVFKTKTFHQTEEHNQNKSVAIYMYPIFNQKNKVDQIAIMERDITALKRAEKEIRKALDREKELNQLRSGIISTVSHEFRTPMAVILSNIQVVHKYHHKLTPEQFHSKFQLIYGSINQLDYMLDNISLLDKNARGLLRYNPTKIVLEDQISQIVEELNSITGTTERIETRFPVPVGHVIMDPMLLRHILSNLLSNALKFSEETTSVVFETVPIKNNKIRFVVSDKGRGIRKDELENIWEPFFRGSNSEGIKGTGIGISIVRSCTQLCGGKIKIKSTFEKGTKVSVFLPFEKQTNLV